MDTKHIVNGAIGGFLGGAALIVLFFFYDLARGEPMATPTFLAAAVVVSNPGVRRARRDRWRFPLRSGSTRSLISSCLRSSASRLRFSWPLLDCRGTCL